MFCIKEVTAMSEETLFEKLGVKYIEKDGIFYPLITLGGEENSTDVGKYGRMLEYIENEWVRKHKPNHANSFVEMYQLRTQARMIAEEVVLHDVVNCFH